MTFQSLSAQQQRADSFVQQVRSQLLTLVGPVTTETILELGGRISHLPDRVGYYSRVVEDLRSRAITGVKECVAIQDFRTYHTMPVSMEQFLTDPYFLNKQGELYPVVKQELMEMNSGKYVELVLTGGIGSAKSTCAVYTTAYQVYLLSCMRNPHEVFGQDRTAELIFIFQSINARLAKAVEFNRFKALIDQTKYFQNEFKYDKNLLAKLVFPNRIEVVPVSGAETAAIGQNVIGGVIDELNYMQVVEKSKQSVDQGQYDQAIAVYNSIARRRKSRFIKDGKQLPGILCLVSSKRYPGQFTDIKEEEAKTDPTIYVYDKRVWDVKPPGTFSPKRFRVFIGDENRRPRILREDEELQAGDTHLIDEIPTEFQKEFEKDITNALREIAGRSTLARFPFIANREAVAACLKAEHLSIFSHDDTDFLTQKVQIYPGRFHKPKLPRYVHVDLALTGDSAGLAIGAITGFVEMTRSSPWDDKPIIELLPNVWIDGVLEIKPPKGGEILFEKIRRILYMLRDMGMAIRWVTFDTFQSSDSAQILRQHGFVTGMLSMDTTNEPYDFTKAALYDGRVDAPHHDVLLRELTSLERDPKQGKIDHPPRGSKDCSDAVAGVVYGVSSRREYWSLHKVPVSRIPPALSGAFEKVKTKEQTAEEKQVMEDDSRVGRRRLGSMGDSYSEPWDESF